MKKARRFLVAVMIIVTAVTFIACNKIGNANFKVSFEVDGKAYYEISTKGEEELKMPDDPTKENYVFDGWYWDKDTWLRPFTAKSLLQEKLTANMTVYAKWIEEELKNKKFEIIFNSMGGSSVAGQTVQYEHLVTEPQEEPTKADMLFAGWFKEPDYRNEWSFATDLVKGETTLYAKWVADIPENRKYTVAFNSNGGSKVESYVKLAYKSHIAPPEIPEKEGFAFVGWYFDNTFAKEWNYDLDEVTDNITLYARWVDNADAKGCSILSATGFEIDGLTLSIVVPNSKNSMNLTELITVSPWATWEVYSDKQGINKIKLKSVSLKEGDNVFYVFVKSGMGPGTYENLYTLNIRRREIYNVTFVYNNGEPNDVVSFEEDSLITIEEDKEIAKVGYTFKEWQYNEEIWDLEQNKITKEIGHMTLEAMWTANEYEVQFNSMGGSAVEQKTVTFDKEFSFGVPTKEGYTFGGWKTAEGTILTNKDGESIEKWVIAENITIYARWELAKYEIKYHLAGGVNDEENPSEYTILSENITFKQPKRDGYEFRGWFADSGLSIGITGIATGSFGDKEAFAKWEVIVYKATYIVPEGTINTNIVEFTVETDITMLANATLKGHSFDGWFSDEDYINPVTRIAGGRIGDMTIYGKFTALTYNVWMDGNEEAEYEVSFNLNGASGSVDSQTINETTTLVYPVIPERSGFLFAGWYDNAECAGKLFDFTAQVKKDIVLYAKWIECDVAQSIVVGSKKEITLQGQNEVRITFVPIVSGNVTIRSIGGIDTYGKLYNDQGVLISQDDDGAGDDLNFLMVYNVTAGKAYTVVLRGFGSSVSGKVELSVMGGTIVSAGGYVVTATKAQATFGQNFSLAVPDAIEGYKFLGYEDADGMRYTDEKGQSIKTWDKDVDSVLYSVWERTVYTVTFNTQGGSSIDDATLAFGDRLDLNDYVTTKNGYSFVGWYLNTSDTEVYDASTMPDHNITLYAKWKTFALGSIKYDETKKAISVNDIVSAELFDAICLDADGKLATFTATISGAQTAGSTVSIRLVATSGNKTKQVIIKDIKVYGEPSLVLTNPQTDYVNLNGGLTAEWFGATGTDSFGEATEIIVSVIDGNAGDIGSIIIKSIDSAGNINSRTIENIKLYGLPVITYQEEKDSIKESDVLAAELFNAVAEDSFGEPVNVEITKYSGTIVAGKTVTLKFKATDSKGNVSTFNKIVKVYGKPSITDAENTEFRVEDRITAETLGLTALDTYSQELEIVLEIKNGTQTAGSVVIFSASAIDVAGNIAQKDISVKIYGAPTIRIGRTDIKVTENPVTPIVSFNLNGGEGNIVSQAVTQEKPLKYPDIPTRSGYVFAGWYSTAECSGTPYDFALDVGDDITLYAKWISHTGTGVIGYNASETIYVESKNNSTDYYAFVPLVSGTVSIYSASGLSDTYGYLYDANKKQLKSDDDGGDGNNFKIEYTVVAGTIYYVRPCGYSSSGVTTIYIQGATPTAGGRGCNNVLAISAIDSFGADLQYSVALKSGTLVGGTTAIYTITAVDKLGNICVMDTSPIKMYDINDIQFSYFNMASDLIKLSSKGEEFSAVAIDSFGDSCDITIEAAQGYTFAGGQIVSLYIVATDNAGNKVTSELISNIKVYDMPTAELTDKAKGYTITEDGDLSFLFTVRDSFGQEIYVEITTEDELIGGTYINVTVTAIDDAGNTLVEHYEVAVIYTEKPFVELYINDVLWQTLFVDDAANYILPVPTDWELPFVRWQDKNGNIYTDANGIGEKTLSTYNMLVSYSDYKAIRTAEDLQNISLNMSGKYMLVNDIDMRGFTWTPIGSSSKTGEYFNGILDGNGYNITNLTLSGGNLYAGLFGYSKGTISNINLINASISGSLASGYGYGYSGAIVAYMNGGTISNCFVSGTVNFSGYSQFGGTGYAGGIVGYLSSGTISNCRTELSVRAQGDGGDWLNEPKAYAGGIVACVYSGIIENCITNGDVTASTDRYAYSGGIVGYIAKCDSSTTKISQCASMAAVVSRGGTYRGFCYSGGLIGYIDANSSSSVIVSQSYATGDVIVTAGGGGSYSSYMPYSYAGGFVGYNKNAEISHCYALGTVKASSGVNVNTDSSEYTSTSVAGGFAAVNAGTIKNCYATGNVVANTDGASETLTSGGFVGTNSGSLTQCIAFGNVSSNGTNSTATYYSGGFVGNNTSGSTSGTISSCYRNSNQTVSKSTNSSGNSSSYENLVKSSFYTSKPSWSTSIWVFNDGNYPILAWQSV